MPENTSPEQEDQTSEQPPETPAPERDADGKIIEPDAQKKEINS